MVSAVHREREMTGAAQIGSGMRQDRAGKGGLTAGAHYVIGRVLVWAGRTLQGDAAPRPKPYGQEASLELYSGA